MIQIKDSLVSRSLANASIKEKQEKNDNPSSRRGSRRASHRSARGTGLNSGDEQKSDGSLDED